MWERTDEEASKTVYLNDMIHHFRIEHSIRRSILISVRWYRKHWKLVQQIFTFFCRFYIHIVAGFKNLANIIPMRKNTIQEKHNREGKKHAHTSIEFLRRVYIRIICLSFCHCGLAKLGTSDIKYIWFNLFYIFTRIAFLLFSVGIKCVCMHA